GGLLVGADHQKHGVDVQGETGVVKRDERRVRDVVDRWRAATSSSRAATPGEGDVARRGWGRSRVGRVQRRAVPGGGDGRHGADVDNARVARVGGDDRLDGWVPGGFRRRGGVVGRVGVERGGTHRGGDGLGAVGRGRGEGGDGQRGGRTRGQRP